jgi:hypothetical protein
VSLLSVCLSRGIGLASDISEGVLSAMPSGLLFQNRSPEIVYLDVFPSCSRCDFTGVRGRFNSWSCAANQRDFRLTLSRYNITVPRSSRKLNDPKLHQDLFVLS